MKSTKRINYIKLYFWCISFLKKYSVFVGIYFVFMAIQQAAFVILPKIIQQLIDGVFIGGKNEMFINLSVYTIIAIVLIIISRVIYGLCVMVYSEKGMKDIQYKVIDKARELGYAYFENTSRGKFLSETYQNILSIYFIFVDFLPNMLQFFCQLVFSTMMIVLSKNSVFIGVTFICFIGEIVLTLVSKDKVHDKNEECRASSNQYYKSIYESTESQQEIRGYQASEWITSRLHQIIKRSFLCQSQSLIIEKVLANCLNIFQVIAIITYFSLGIINRGSLSIGNVVAYYTYVFMAISSFSNLCNLLIRQEHNLVDAQKPYEFMKLEPQVIESANAISTSIKGDILARNLSFQYHDNESVINDFSLKINKGEKVVIVGGSGCGKTTFLKLLLRFYDCNKGELLLDGIPIEDYSFDNLRDSLGIVFQDTFLFSDSIMENLKFANPDASDDEIKRACKLACAHEFIMNLPDKYDTILGARGNTLSGGEKQRLSIARLLIKDPSIYLFDESTSELDNITEEKVLFNLFSNLNEQTLIMTSHRISVIKKFHRIVVLKEGNIVEDGKFEELYKEGTYFFNLVSRGLISYER